GRTRTGPRGERDRRGRALGVAEDGQLAVEVRRRDAADRVEAGRDLGTGQAAAGIAVVGVEVDRRRSAAIEGELDGVDAGHEVGAVVGAVDETRIRDGGVGGRV